MGTQFQSRLSAGDIRRIKEGVRLVYDVATESEEKEQKAHVDALPADKQQRLGDATTTRVLAASLRRLFDLDDFAQNREFRDALDFLMKAHDDAKTNKFQDIIETYKLEEQGSPVAVLTQAVKHLTKKPKGEEPNRFRVATNEAAKAVLAQVVTETVPKDPKASQAEYLGKKFATMDRQDIVTHYVDSFVKGIIMRIMIRASTDLAEPSIRETLDLTEHSAEQMTQRAISRIVDEDQLDNTTRIHEIVTEELQNLSESEKHFRKEIPPGSVRLTLELSPEQAEKLFHNITINEKFKRLNVFDARLVEDDETDETRKGLKASK